MLLAVAMQKPTATHIHLAYFTEPRRHRTLAVGVIVAVIVIVMVAVLSKAQVTCKGDRALETQVKDASKWEYGMVPSLPCQPAFETAGAYASNSRPTC